MAQRLMALQRRRLAESRVLDQHACRALHDDVLPQLHAAMLALSARRGGAATEEAMAGLTAIHRQLSQLLRETPAAVAPEVARAGLLPALRRLLEGELRGSFDAVEWQVPPEVEARAASIPASAAEVLFYAAREAARNAARHARGGDPDRLLTLRVSAAWEGGEARSAEWGTQNAECRVFCLVVEDDGVGMGAAGSGSGGSGQGLALHGTLMAVIGGTLAVESAPGQYTRVLLTLPEDVEGRA